MFRELLFDSRIKLAQSPLFDRPPLMFKPCPPPPIQRPQCRDVWNRLFELTTEMAQNRGGPILPRSQIRAGQADEAELPGRADPMSRSKCPAGRGPVSILGPDPLLRHG